jgi:peptide/nickel transport system permease protein
VLRSQVLVLRSREFVDAVQALGASMTRTVLMHVVPNVVSSLIVIATLELARAIVLEATLSFLGLGVPPPLPSWGLMISEGKDYMFFSPWVIMIPGVTLFVFVLGVNFVGDGLRTLLGAERPR